MRPFGITHVRQTDRIASRSHRGVQKGLIGKISAGAAIYCVASYDPDVALDMLERMQQLGVSLLKDSYHQVLKGLSQNGNLYSAMQLFETMVWTQAHHPPRDQERGTLLHSLAPTVLRQATCI